MKDAEVSDIGQGVSKRRQLPVQYRDHAGEMRVEYEVVDPEVAVDEGDAVGHTAIAAASAIITAAGAEPPHVFHDLAEPFDRPNVFRLVFNEKAKKGGCLCFFQLLREGLIFVHNAKKIEVHQLCV